MKEGSRKASGKKRNGDPTQKTRPRKLTEPATKKGTCKQKKRLANQENGHGHQFGFLDRTLLCGGKVSNVLVDDLDELLLGLVESEAGKLRRRRHG